MVGEAVVEDTLVEAEAATTITTKEKKKKCDLQHKARWQKDIMEPILQ